MRETPNTQPVTPEVLHKLLGELQASHDELVAAKLKEEAARRDATDALNRANAAQRAFDQAFGRYQKESPRDTHWFDVTHRRGATE